MLEKLIQDLIEALNANTAAIAGNAGAATSGSAGGEAGGKRGRPSKDAGEKSTKPKFTVEQASAVLLEIKEAHGLAHAKEILGNHGVAKMAEMPADKADAIYAEAKAKLEELNKAAAENNSDDEI